MITLALMLADEENRKLFSEIAKELEEPLKKFASDLSNSLIDTTSSLANTTKTGLKLYAEDITTSISNLAGVAAPNIQKLADRIIKLKDSFVNLATRVKSLDSFQLLKKQMDSVALNAKKSALEFFSFQNVLKVFSNSISHAAMVGDLAKALDVNTESFSNWADVVTNSGGNINSFGSSVKGLKKHLDEAGSSKDVFDYLIELSDQMQTMSNSEADALGEKLNIDPTTIALLKEGSVNLQAMLSEQKKLGGITQEDSAIAKEFTNVLNDFKYILRSVAITIGSVILPPLTWLLDKIKIVVNYLAQNKDFVIGFFIGIAAVLSTTLLPALWGAFAPILAVIAVVAAIGLAFGAVYSVIKGNIDAIGNAFFQLVDIVTAPTAMILDIFNFFINAIAALVNAFITLFTEGPKEALEYFKNAILGALNKLYDNLPSWVKKLLSGVKGFFSSESNSNVETLKKELSIDDTLDKGSKSLNNAQANSQILVSSGSQPVVANNNQVSYRNNFNITSNNPEEVGRIVDEKMRTMNKEAEESFDDGVLA